MHIPAVANLVPVIVLLAVTRAEWEVFNGARDVDGDELNLVEEQFIPAEGTKIKGNQANLRNLASFDQLNNKNMNPKTDLKNTDPKKKDINPADVSRSSKSATYKETDSISNAKSTTPLTSTTRRKAAVSKLATTPKTLDILDDSDITAEGFLLVNDAKSSRTSRKLTQFVESFSQDTQESIQNLKDFDDRSKLSEDDPMNQKHLLEEGAMHPLVDMAGGMSPSAERQQNVKEENIDSVDTSLQERQTKANEFDPSLMLACIDDTSWECMMFREDYLTMQNLSGRERIKRQAPAEPGSTPASQNMSQVIGCEQGDCFSGNGTDTNEEVVEPQFSYGKTTEMDTNRTKLNETERQKIANDTILQLTEIFKNVPGFKNVTVDPDKIVRTTDGELLIPWDVFIDGGDPVFSGMDGQQVRDAIDEALKQAVEPYKTNFTVDNQHPKDGFNSTEAADQVQQQATDPCKMDPDPCPIGFGTCTRLPDRNNGIELKCIDNCYIYPLCGNNGVCQKDMAGKAYCLCAAEWAGMYCDRQNDSLTPTNQITTPPYSLPSQSKFNTTLTQSDLTPEKRAEIAKNMTNQLSEQLKNVPGFQNVTVDPDSIRIDENGQLVVVWNVSLDPKSYSGQNPDQIGDTVRESLLNVMDTYRNSLVIDGQKPVEDFDAVAAANQIELQASNLCRTEPCAPGYTDCIALNTTSVICNHNCNAIPVCQHGGTCQIDSVGSANCQCPSNWSGDSCEQSTDNLDGGEIAGVVVGGALLTAGTAGLIYWFLLARKGDNINFTTYTDEEGTSTFSDPNSRLCVIDRPEVSQVPDSLYASSPYVPPEESIPPSSSDNAS